jgi:hypothetical protein
MGGTQSEHSMSPTDLPVIAILGSPLQLLCGYEAAKRFELGNVHASYVYPKRNGYTLQGEAEFLSKNFGSNSLTAFRSSSLGRMFQALMMGLRHQGCQYVILGQLGSRFNRIVVKMCKPRHVLIVDDGIETVSTIRETEKNVASTYEGFPMTFFTLFPSKSVTTLSCVQNRFDAVKERGRTMKREVLGTVFLGVDWVEHNMASEEEYFQLLRASTQAGTLEDCVYYAHRFERDEKLDRIRQEFGFSIRRSPVGIEWEIASRIDPSQLIGLPSSAMITLSTFATCPVRCVIPPRHWKSHGTRSHFCDKVVNMVKEWSHAEIHELQF